MYSLFMGKGQPLDSGTQDTYIYNLSPAVSRRRGGGYMFRRDRGGGCGALVPTAQLAEEERRGDSYIERLGVRALDGVGRNGDAPIDIWLQIGVYALPFVAHNQEHWCVLSCGERSRVQVFPTEEGAQSLPLEALEEGGGIP